MRKMSWMLWALLLALQSCSSVDQYGSRIYDGNLNAQAALDQETLLNVVRASRYQPLNFMAISSVTGGQSESLATGLPTLSFGPNQVDADGVYKVTNTLTSGVTSGYTSSPLITTAFQSGMLAPVNVRTVAQLAAFRPREAVFMLLIDGITVTLPNGERAFLKNDPTTDAPDCPARVDEASAKNGIFPGGVCSYTKFSKLLQALVGNGLSAELTPSTAANAATIGAVGRFCFDPSLAGLNYQAEAAGEFKAVCGTPPSKNAKLGISYPGIGVIRLEIVMRSPVGVYAYLGSYLRKRNSGKFYGYYSRPAQQLLGNEPYLNVTSIGKACYTSIKYLGEAYCIPRNSAHTAMMLEIAQVLRNLSIQPTDLNSPLAIRVTP